MATGLLVLRIVTGALIAAHGAQKLVGWFGGPGLVGITGAFRGLGFRAPGAMALLAGLSEIGGLAFAAGFLTPVFAAGMVGLLTTAVVTVQWRVGWTIQKGPGWEYNLLAAAAIFAVCAIGPGRYSIDHAIGWDDNISGVWWGVAVIGTGIAGGLAIVALFFRRPAPAPESPALSEAPS